MHRPDKIVLEHAGALGDFLLAWPALVSVARHFSGLPIHFHVRSAHAPWLAPVAKPCPPVLLRALEDRYAGDSWPEALADVLVVRPGLGRSPAFPESPRFWFLGGIVPGRDTSPGELYRDALAARGVPSIARPAALFQSLFGASAPKGNAVLLFPGAGHPDKAWPLDRLEVLADRLARFGARPIFVLGPAEIERGIRPRGGESLRPESLAVLSRALCAARCVVGPDCGPMHLAALHGVPGVALFGPTSPAQWGPPGMPVLTAGLPCAPCVAMTADAFAPQCPRPLPCLVGIDVETVWRAIVEGLGAGRGGALPLPEPQPYQGG